MSPIWMGGTVPEPERGDGMLRWGDGATTKMVNASATTWPRAGSVAVVCEVAAT